MSGWLFRRVVQDGRKVEMNTGTYLIAKVSLSLLATTAGQGENPGGSEVVKICECVDELRLPDRALESHDLSRCR